MYCDRCGTSLASSAQFCSSCGKSVIRACVAPAAPAPPPLTEGRVRRHIHRLATFWLINGVLRLLAVSWFMLFGTVFFPFMRNWGGPVVWPLGHMWGGNFFLPR